MSGSKSGVDWRSVSDGLPEMIEPYPGGPKQSERVLIWTGTRVSIGALQESYKQRRVSWKDYAMYGSICTPSHWAPLPNGPIQ